MPNYRIYGVNLASNMYLPGVVPVSPSIDTSTDIEVFLGELPKGVTPIPYASDECQAWYNCEPSSDQAKPPLQVWLVQEKNYFYFLYDDETTFVVDRQGRNIWATWPDWLTLEDTATYLLGPVLGFVLRLRDVVCLHASAVVVENRVIAFLGDAGAGKSTTVAAFAQLGQPVVSEDVVALVDHGTQFLVQPGYPLIRLWDSSVEALFGSSQALPRLVPTHPTWDKRFLDLTRPEYQFQEQPLSLAAIYYLHERSDDLTSPKVEPLAPEKSLVTLLTNTYTNYLLDKDQRALEFDVLARLVKHIPIWEITPHSDIKQLPRMLDLVLSHCSMS